MFRRTYILYKVDYFMFISELSFYSFCLFQYVKDLFSRASASVDV